jgi:hypothetical protein
MSPEEVRASRSAASPSPKRSSSPFGAGPDPGGGQVAVDRGVPPREADARAHEVGLSQRELVVRLGIDPARWWP